jgi:hypothetical protein
MATMNGFDMGFGANAAAVFGSLEMDGDEYVRCMLCHSAGVDVRVSSCGCTSHARCIQLNPHGSLSNCPFCTKPTQGLVLFPMSFREIDEAHRTASALPPKPQNRGRKRKTGADLIEDKGYVAERRTGRWTNEEMSFCDKLMDKFANGDLPVADGVKLNEFLGNMLKSKQSRLTKKMKNAKLSSKTYQKGIGCLTATDASEFSDLEELFFQAIPDLQERAEIKFHMQKEWREQFSRVCATVGQPLDADSWLGSVEEMDRRASQTRDAARMAKRKLMMGVALRTDSQNPDDGVFIEKTEAEARAAGSTYTSERDVEDEMLSILAEDKAAAQAIDLNGKSSLLHSAPFLSKTTSYLQRLGIPFEHVDLWVPSFVPGDGEDLDSTTCRLCFAGSATVDKVIEQDGKSGRSLTTEERFNLFAFGDYSQKFSFDVGCGLPGRVYESGRPTWEQSVHNAPHNHFERCGGALQWGIKTVVGIPIASPNVGRIVVTLYSCYDRPKDEDLVSRLSEEFTRLMPSPKWKLVVDIGDVEETPSATYATAGTTSSTAAQVDGHDASDNSKESIDISIVASVASNPVEVASSNPAAISAYSGAEARDPRIEQVVAMMGDFMPSDPNSLMAPYMQGFMSLRLLLLRHSLTSEESELSRTILDSFSSYTAGGRDRGDIAIMLARDFMFLSHQQQQAHHPSFLNLGENMMGSVAGAHTTTNTGLSLFGLPSTSSSLQNSPALTPIPGPGTNDSMSIVSN